MTSVLTALKWIDAPGSTPFFVICCAIALVFAFVWPRRRRAALMWMGAVVGAYLVLALPCVAHSISGALPPVNEATVVPGQRLGAVVVFDGDNRRGRVREAMRLYASAAPAGVWSLGRERWMEGALRAAGIPPDRLTHDRATGTTTEQMAWTRRFVATGAHQPVAIVASRLQMPRIAALRTAMGVQALMAIAPADVEPSTSGIGRFIPTYFALRISRDALYEHIALWYYRRKGWIR